MTNSRLAALFGCGLLALLLIVSIHIGGDQGALLAFLTGVIAIGAIAALLLVRRRNSLRQAAQERWIKRMRAPMQSGFSSVHFGLLDSNGYPLDRTKQKERR